MTVAVVDSGGANIASVLHALKRLGAEPEFTSDADRVRSADRVILPGVGAATTAMEHLRERGLDAIIPGLRQPVLGVCLGMQLLFESTEEGDAELLGLIPARVTRLRTDGLRVPHMGWNQCTPNTNERFCRGIENNWFYFVHSYAAPVGPWTIANCTHGKPFSAMVRHGNFLGAQFHPERSARGGARLLERFLKWEGI